MTHRKMNLAIIAIATFAGWGGTALPVSAEIINNDITIGKSALKQKCRAAGGNFTTYSDGTYGCIIHKPDGSLTTVSCERNGECVGTSGARETAQRRKSSTVSGSLLTQGAATPLPRTKPAPMVPNMRVMIGGRIGN